MAHWKPSALIWLVLTWPVAPAVSDQGTPLRDQAAIVAAYLLNFGRFVEWPDGVFPSNQAPVRICSYGDDLLGRRLDDLAQKRLHERPIETQRIRRGESVSGCNILYVSESEAFYVNRVLEQNAPSPVLTVSGIRGFADKGGVVGLITIDNKLRFEINEHAAARSGLKVSSQLLKLAKRVLNGGGTR